jgi:tRNA nucleotidyltransferase/poly(A) polymerase
MNMPPQVTAIIQKLNGRGYEAYIVGGCVRDGLIAAGTAVGVVYGM